ncbi:MAG TPA: hypothetical protein VHZ78_10120 [Rhizomicrobium sp.]|jgi:hypothetical protein|nr:hypothetical protein [Rhizomicrobium sp.]
MDAPEPVPGLPGATMRRVAELPSHLPDGKPAGQFTHAIPGLALMVMPGTGIFLARDGSTIEFTEEPQADSGAVALYLNGSARGALIHQRGELPLHAATLVPPGGDKALAICGRSGAGKSTLAAELSRRGWALVADDTTRVTWDGARAIAWPSRDTIKLWKDACEMAGIDMAALQRVMRNMDKYYIRVTSHGRPVPLGWILELTPDGAVDLLSAGDKMALVTRNTYRPAQIRPLGMEREHVRIVAQTASATTVFRLPGDRSLSLAALADAVEKAVR